MVVCYWVTLPFISNESVNNITTASTNANCTALYKATAEEQALWEVLSRFSFNSIDAAFSFTDRLKRENNWSYKYTLQAVEEYRKFIFLICISTGPLTPSDQIDQVWHLHLIYTQSYWNSMCRDVLNRDIHHGPTKGGTAEKQKYANCYQNTLDLYKKIFGYEPPEQFWPPAAKRFTSLEFRRVEMKQHWVIRKPKFFKWKF